MKSRMRGGDQSSVDGRKEQRSPPVFKNKTIVRYNYVQSITFLACAQTSPISFGAKEVGDACRAD